MKKKNRTIQLFGEVKDVEITRKIYFLIITLMEKLNLYLNSLPYSLSSSLYLQDILVFFFIKRYIDLKMSFFYIGLWTIVGFQKERNWVFIFTAVKPRTLYIACVRINGKWMNNACLYWSDANMILFLLFSLVHTFCFYMVIEMKKKTNTFKVLQTYL